MNASKKFKYIVSYGSTCDVCTKEVSKERRKSTFKEKYGVECILQSETIIQRIKSTNLEKYGHTCPLVNKDIKEKVKQIGLRNSLMIAPMPTASTSQIMGFNECFEPFTSNLYKRKTMAGEFILVNKYLINDLIELNLWNKDLKDKIMLSDGSVQNIKEIPDDIKSLYKTVWEIKQKVLIDQAADRGKYICQSQSMNLFVEDPDFKKLSSMHFYSWSSGLKTGMYYLRSKPKAKQQKFTIDPNLQKFANVNKKEESKQEKAEESDKEIVCTDEICLVCSS
jgi:ribonucleoside-diphosphate reductase alpha chain